VKQIKLYHNIRALRLRPSLAKEKESCVKIPSEERKHINVPLTLRINPQVMIFSFNKKKTFEDLEKIKQALKTCP